MEAVDTPSNFCLSCLITSVKPSIDNFLPIWQKKWRFRTEYQHDKEAFLGDGSRGGPERREFDGQERAKL